MVAEFIGTFKEFLPPQRPQSNRIHRIIEKLPRPKNDRPRPCHNLTSSQGSGGCCGCDFTRSSNSARRTARSLLAIARIAVSTTSASSEASPEVISPLGDRGGDCRHERAGIGRPLERRQVEPQAAVAAPRMEAFKAQLERRRIAFECHLDRLSGQRLGLAFEQ